MLVQIPGATNLNAVSLQHWLRTNYPRFRYDVRGSNVLALAGNGNAGILMKPVGGTSVKLQWTIPNQGAVIIIVLLTIAALGLGLVMMLGAWLSSRSVTDKLTNELAHVLRTGQPPHGDLAPAYRETTTQDKINLMIITGGGCSLLIGATAFLGGVAEGAFGAIFVGLLFIAGGVALVKLWLKRRAETEGQAAGPSPVAHGAPNAQHQQPQHPQPQYGHAQYQQPQYQQPQYQQPQYQQPQYQQPQPGYPQHQEPQYAQPQSGLAPSSPNGPLPAGPPLSPHGPGAWRVH